MKKRALVLVVIAAAWLAPVASGADHDPSHDTRHNPNCAWDSRRSTDANHDGEPDHFSTGLAHDTSFPRQVVTLLEPYGGPDQVPPFFGGHDGPDQITFWMQGDHRMLGANPTHDPDSGDPEQLHNGAIYAHVDYDDIENGRAPRARVGAGVYEANHLVMACAGTEEDPEAALCLNGQEFYRMTDEECPQD